MPGSGRYHANGCDFLPLRSPAVLRGPPEGLATYLVNHYMAVA